MNNLTLFFDNAWKWKCGLPEDELPEMGKSKLGNVPDLEDLIKMQIVPEFKDLEKAADVRMIIGVFRYKLRKGHDFFNYKMLKEIRKKLNQYEETKNLEDLVDAFNYVRIEYLRARWAGYIMKPVNDEGIHAEYLDSK
jgi:hypothetical protein